MDGWMSDVRSELDRIGWDGMGRRKKGVEWMRGGNKLERRGRNCEDGVGVEG